MKNIYLCIVIILTANCSQRQQHKIQPYVSEMGNIKHYFNSQNSYNGSVLIADGNQILLSRSYGYKTHKKQKKNSLDTRFGLASVGKMFTAIAIMQLYEKGLLDLQQKVGGILPDYPNKHVINRVTVHQLLTHTSGLGNYFNEQFDKADKNKITALQDYLSFFKDDELNFKPGERFGYSNVGYVVLGLIIEQLSHMSYYDYIKAHVFKPLAMNDSGWYSIGERGNSAGGGYSTVWDMYQFAKAIKNNGLISQKSKELVLKGSRANKSYGYGLSVKEFNGKIIYGHNGGAPGVATELDIYQGSDLIVVTLTNRDPYNGWVEARSIIRQQFLGNIPAITSFLNAQKIIKAYEQSGYKNALLLLKTLDNDIRTGNIIYKAEKYLERDNAIKAQKLVQLLIIAKPDDWYTHSFLADIYLKQGNKTLAKVHYHKSLEINPNNQQAKEQLKEIE